MTPSSSLLTTDPMVTPLSSSNQEPPNAIQYSRDATAEGDDRSSSLSEIGDRVGNEIATPAKLALADGSEANDTEAETERLEVSPQRTRKRKNVIMTSLDHVLSNGASPAANQDLPTNDGNNEFPVGKIDPLSEISSIADSGEDNGKLIHSLSPNTRKRKRPSSEGGSQSDAEYGNKPPLRSPENIGNEPHNAPTDVEQNETLSLYKTEEEQKPGDTHAKFPTDEVEAPNVQQFLLVKQQSRKGKRKGKKARDDTSIIPGSTSQGDGVQSDLNGNIEGEYSNGEDAEIEEAGDDGEIDTTARNEEGLLKKKSAMDSLSAIEKCFATLRDKLYVEKLAQYNEELAMLDQPNPTHPDFIQLKRVIDKHRDDKIEYEQHLLKYKLIALQRKSTAEKAQIHAQYMQTVRDIRERMLEQLQKESYQLQRERRKVEKDVLDYSYQFPAKKSQQIANQTAYNTEVSILSGIAKHVGFPSAPEILGAKQSEIEEDFLAMGIPMQETPRVPPSISASRSALPGGAAVSRRKPAAEEEYMELHPWANPQHPAHHNLHLSRQVSNVYRPNSRLSTPGSQRRNADVNFPQGSTSTVVDPHSGPNSSAVQTPATREQIAINVELSRDMASDNLTSITPTHVMKALAEAPTTNLSAQETTIIDKGKKAQLGMKVQSSPSSTSRALLQRNQSAADTAPKTSKVVSSIDKPIGPTTVQSPIIRYPVVKAEEPLHPSRQTPIQYHHSPVSANPTPSGQVDRIGA